MNNKKLYRVLSTAAIASAIAACVGGTASAKVTGVLLNNGGSTSNKYDYTALKLAYAMDGVDATKAALYTDYKASGSIVGYYDDVKQGYVDANDVKLAYAGDTTGKFTLDGYTESSVAKLLNVTNLVYDVTADASGKITRTAETTGLSVSSVSAITTTGFTINFDSKADLTAATLPKTVTLTPTSGTAVTGTITYDNTAKTATVTAALTAGTTYTATAAGLNFGTNTIAVSNQLAVSSVSAINTQQLKVTFNKEVTTTSAETLANYKLDGASISGINARAKLLDDNKTVIVTLNAAKNQNTTQTFSIDTNTIQDKSTGVYAPAYSKSITFVDVTAPTVESVVVTGNKTIKVTFSGAVYSTNAAKAVNYKVDGQSLAALGGSATAVAGFSGTTWTNQVTLNFDTALSAGSHTLTVAASTASADAISDPASFTLAKVDNAFTVNNVSTEPTVSSITGQTSGVVKIVFCEAMDSTTLASAFDVNGSGWTNGTLDPTDTTNHTVLVTVSSTAVKSGANVLTIKKNVVADIYGNKIAPTATDDKRVSFDATKDTVAPTVSNVYPVSETQIRVNFSKVIDTAYLTSANFVLKDANGKVIYGGTGTAWDSITSGVSDNSVVLLNLTAAHAKVLGSAQYTLAVSNVADPAGNVITASSNTFTTLDKTAPELAASNNLLINATNKTATVYFDEPMDTTSIGTLSNYLYNADTTTLGTSFVAIPDGSSIAVASDAKSATITFPSTVDMSAWSTKAKLRAVGVKDAAGNVISGGTADTAVAALSSTANNPDVVAKSGTISADSSKVTVSFTTDQQLTAVKKDDFTLANLGIGLGDLKGLAAVGDIPASATISGKTVTLTFTNADDMATLKAKGNGLALAAVTYANATNSESAPLKVNTALAITDEVAPELDATTPFKLKTSNSIEVKFDEALKDIPAAYADDFVIVVNGEVVPADKITPTLSGNTLTLTLAGYSTTDASKVNVKVKSTSDLADVTGNAFVPTAAEVAGNTLVDAVGPVLTSATVSESSVAADEKFGDATTDKLILKYSENVKLVTAAAPTGVTSTPSAIVPAEIAKLDPALVVTGGSYTVAVDGNTITIVATATATGALDNATPIATIVGVAGATSNVTDATTAANAETVLGTAITLTNSTY